MPKFTQKTHNYVFFSLNLFIYCRLTKRKMTKTEDMHLFMEIISIVHHCLTNSLLLSEMRMLRFVFSDEAKM